MKVTHSNIHHHSYKQGHTHTHKEKAQLQTRGGKQTNTYMTQARKTNKKTVQTRLRKQIQTHTKTIINKVTHTHILKRGQTLRAADLEKPKQLADWQQQQWLFK